MSKMTPARGWRRARAARPGSAAVCRRLAAALAETSEKLAQVSRGLDEIKRGVAEARDSTQARLNGFIDTFYSLEDIKYANDDVRLLQRVKLTVLLEFKKVCAEHGLAYWLEGGTLVGAVRHRGYIPWDDDIDVSMTGADYEKFKLITASHPVLRLRHMYSYGDFYCGKLTMDHSGIEADIDTELEIDIFVYTYCNYESWDAAAADYERRRQEFRRKLRELRQERMFPIQARYPNPEVDELTARLLAGLYDEHARSFAGGAILDDGRFLLQAANRRRHKPNLFDRQIIFPLREIEFEGQTHYAPADTDWFLRYVYGSYMRLPENLGQLRHFGQDLSVEKYRALEAFLKQREGA